MSQKKRGLGRGLEVLLVDVPMQEQESDLASTALASVDPSIQTPQKKNIKQPATQARPIDVPTTENQAESGTSILTNNIQRERQLLLQEADNLSQLISEFELMLRTETG
jgi:ParB family chromosome partitioning protein